MISRRHFLAAAPLLFPLRGLAESPPAAPIRFGLLADLHQDVMPDGVERATAFVEAMTKAKVDFILQLGDFCVPKEANRPLLQAWEKFRADRYHVLGNHDTDGGFTREQAVKFLGMPKNHYSFDKAGLRYIVLDGNDPGAQKKGYKRYVAPEQLKWLEGEITAAKTPVVIFIHQSLDQPDGVSNQAEVRKVLNTANVSPHKVLAVFSGHHHMNYSKVIDDIAHIQINSASYHWVGDKLAHTSYSADVHKSHPHLKMTCPYEKPLWAVVSIDLNAAILKVEGRTTKWKGGSPWDHGATAKTHDAELIQPEISDRTRKVIQS